MTRTRRTFLFTLAIAVISAASAVAVRFANLPQPVPVVLPVVAEHAPVELTIASSVTKQRWMEDAAARFMAAGTKTADGRPIVISVKGVLSGESMEQILAAQSQPVVWSPGEGSWVEQFNARWSLKSKAPAMKAACKPTIYTPSGIGMWRPMAEALGWPEKPVSWKAIIDLAADPAGWSRYGHPEWGKLKLGYTHPQYSSAGLLFMSALAYGTTGTTSGLTPDKIYAKQVEDSFAAVARNTSKYGMVTTALLDMMAQQGPDYLHAISAFEEGVVRFNMERGKELRFPLAFILPSDGTFWSDHPYCILDGAPWVSSWQTEAAHLFFDFLRKKEMQELAATFLLRPLDAGVATGNGLSLANGTLPNSRPETVPPFAVPDADTAAAIIDQFIATKRKAHVLLVLDVSGSMAGQPIVAATEATAQFLGRLDPRDEVGLLTFDENLTEVSPIRPASDIGEALARRVKFLVAGGGTNLNGAICRAVEIMKADSQSGGNVLRGIVVLSDGADTTAQISDTRMFQTCLPKGIESGGTKIFTIAFGNEANREVLSHIAQVTGGAAFSANQDNIGQAYLKISAEQ